MTGDKAARLHALTDVQIEAVCTNILDGHSPGSRANVYAATREEWPVLAEDLAYLLRRKVKVTGETSDGYHTFNELYDHRITLFVTLCRVLVAEASSRNVWRSKLHSDGSTLDGWFVMGIDSAPGDQITYHLPLSRWDETDFAEECERAPAFDGHTSADVLKRLREIYAP